MVSVAPIIDTSISMSLLHYDKITVIDSQAFIRMSRPGDNIGVVSYDVNGVVTYPPGGTALVTVDGLLKVSEAAAEAIGKLQFYGNCTAIGYGLRTARPLVDRAARPKGLVLLSDGFDTCGPDPLAYVPRDYPLFTCAMGPTSDQQLLAKLATTSPGGKFYYAPKIFDMMMIFNEIAGRLNPNAAVVLNEHFAVDSEHIARAGAVAPIGPDQESAQFVVVWSDAAVRYSPEPGERQIGVQLVQPSGEVWPDPPQVIDPGFVIFHVDRPAAGEWQLSLVLPPTPLPPLDITLGALEFASDQLRAEIDGASLRLSSDADITSVDVALAFVPAVTQVPELAGEDAKAFFTSLDASAFAPQEVPVHASGEGAAWTLAFDAPPGGFYSIRAVVRGSRDDGGAFQRTVIGSGTTVV